MLQIDLKPSSNVGNASEFKRLKRTGSACQQHKHEEREKAYGPIAISNPPPNSAYNNSETPYQLKNMTTLFNMN